MSGIVAIRAAERPDAELLFELILELAEYERARDQVTGSEQQLAMALFGAAPKAEAVIAELDGRPAGFALFFETFSTWLCAPGLWLEDLYVREHERRHGVGRALLAHVAALAVERGSGRLEWSALDWNAPALSFYERVGAERMDEWCSLRLAGAALRRVSAGTDLPGGQQR